MLKNIIVTKEVLQHVHSKGHGQHLVIYRDIPLASCTRCSGSMTIKFVPSVKVISKEPDLGYFTLIGSDGGVAIWVERALLTLVNESSQINITLKKGLRKTLKLKVT